MMGQVFASGKNAIGVCEICGWKHKLHDLRFNSYGLRVCPTDYDGAFDLKNHPQNFSPRVSPDPQSLWKSSPDVNLAVAGTIWDDNVTWWDSFNTHWFDEA